MGIRRIMSTSAGTETEKVRPGTRYAHVQTRFAEHESQRSEAYRRSFVTKSKVILRTRMFAIKRKCYALRLWLSNSENLTLQYKKA